MIAYHLSSEQQQIIVIARETTPRAIRRLVELVDSPDGRVAIMAADKVLERAWGKPKEQEVDPGPMAGISKEVRQRYLMELLAYAASLKVPPEFEATLEPVVIDDEEPER